MADHLLPSATSLLGSEDAFRIAHIQGPRWISHPVAGKAHDAMRLLLDRPSSLRPRGVLLAGPYHNGKTMIAERFAIEHLRQSDRQRVWVIQTREGAGLSHFYASILSGLRAPQAAGWKSLSRAGEQVDHLLESLKPRVLIFDEFHSACGDDGRTSKPYFRSCAAWPGFMTFRLCLSVRSRSTTQSTIPKKWVRGLTRSQSRGGGMMRISQHSSTALRPACRLPCPRDYHDSHWRGSFMICRKV